MRRKLDGKILFGGHIGSIPAHLVKDRIIRNGHHILFLPGIIHPTAVRVLPIYLQDFRPHTLCFSRHFRYHIGILSTT